MLGYEMIEKCIKTVLRDNSASVSIYPCGVNGLNTKTVLKLAFGIVPNYLVDNNKSLKDAEFISYDRYIKHIKKDEYIILTIEDKLINEQMYLDLKKHFPENRIINLLLIAEDLKKNYNIRMAEKLSLKNILPDYNSGVLAIQSHKNVKIKIRVLFSRTQSFNAISSMCEEFVKDEDVDLQFIIGWDNRSKCADLLDKYNYKYCFWRTYDATEDKPDIFILSQAYDYITNIPNLRENCNLIVVVTAQLTRNENPYERFVEVQRKSFDRYIPDYYLCDAKLYEDIRANDPAFPYQVVRIGNPKYDGIYNACRKKDIPDKWEKLKGKKVVLWATDHGLNDGFVYQTSFDQVIGTILKYASSHYDIGLICRFHNEIPLELIKLGYWSERDFALFKEYCENSPNIIFDENDTYDCAYSISDAIITDASCGICFSGLPTGKPICALFRNIYDKPFYEDMKDVLYFSYGDDDLESFLDMIREGEDPKKEIRNNYTKENVDCFDGGNGKRVYSFIMEKYKELGLK